MRPEARPLLALLIAAVCSTAFGADSEDLLVLRKNPFNRPPIVKAPPPPPPRPPAVVVPPEEVELNLSATMVSKMAPMVVVEGELLGIGDSIRGLRLIAVMEGRAMFVRDGKKFSFEIGDIQPK